MSEGHVNAGFYPLPVLWTEARIARRRQNGRAATEAVLIQSAIGSVLSKDAATGFKKTIAKLTKG